MSQTFTYVFTKQTKKHRSCSPKRDNTIQIDTKGCFKRNSEDAGLATVLGPYSDASDIISVSVLLVIKLMKVSDRDDIARDRIETVTFEALISRYLRIKCRWPRDVLRYGRKNTFWRDVFIEIDVFLDNNIDD